MFKGSIRKRDQILPLLVTITLALGFMVSMGVSVAVAAQKGADYPSRPITFLSLSAPGSGFDTTTRAVVNTLVKEKMVKVPLPVENASNSVAGTANMVNRYKGDPYVLSVHSLNGMMRYATGGSPYSHKDYTPLCGLISTYYGVAVKYDSPYKTLADLVKALKENPEKTPLSGGSSDDRPFYGATFMKAGVSINKINYVAYSGGGESSMAVLEGSVKGVVNSVDELLGLHEGKKLRLLAISSAKRSSYPALKEVPTLREAGVDLEYSNIRYAFAAPAMPEYAIKYWHNVFTKMVKTPTWQQMIKRYQWDDAFQIAGFNDVLDKKQAVVTEVLTLLGMAKKK